MHELDAKTRCARQKIAPGRRSFLFTASATLLTPVLAFARDCDVCALTTEGDDDELVQPASPSPAAFMQIALELRERAVRRGEPAVGAVLALDNVVLAVGAPHVNAHYDPTAHAEMEAIRTACRRHATLDLTGAVLYATTRPCRMCEAAAFYARVSRIVHGEAMIDAGAPRALD
ncbi:MAG TPA: nucleoside deaminase [Burkholderiales bacterium]|nr:nucleoside deaminase [Burkholderiales bacterium]